MYWESSLQRFVESCANCRSWMKQKILIVQQRREEKLVGPKVVFEVDDLLLRATSPPARRISSVNGRIIDFSGISWRQSVTWYWPAPLYRLTFELQQHSIVVRAYSAETRVDMFT